MMKKVTYIFIFLVTSNSVFSQSEYNYYSDINKIEIYKENFSGTQEGWKNYTNTKSVFWIDNGLYLKNTTNRGSYPYYKDITLDSENNYEIEFEFQFMQDLKNTGLFFKLSLDNQVYGVSIYRKNKSGVIYCYLGKWSERKHVVINQNGENTNKFTIRNTSDSLHFYLNENHLSSNKIGKNGILKTISFYPYWKSISKVNNVSISIINRAFEFSKSEIDNLKNTKIAILPIIPSSLISSSISEKIGTGLSDYLQSINKFQLIKEEDIKYALNRENMNYSSLDIFSAVEIGKLLKADAILIGYINNFENNEEYLGRNEKSNYEADKYKRQVSFTLNLKLLSVFDGEIIVDFQKQIEKSDFGFINIRSISNSSLSDENASSTLGAIAGALSIINDILSESLDDKLLSFGVMEESCIEEIIFYTCSKILSSSKLYTFKDKLKDFYNYDLASIEPENSPTKKDKEVSLISTISDIDLNIPKTRNSQPDAIAVVIGNKDYNLVPEVEYAINDARSIKNYLVNVLGFRDGNILFRENISKTDFEEIFGTSEFLTGSRLYRMIKPDVSDVFIFYSGHGAPGLQNLKGYFVPVECDPSYLEFRGYSLDLFYENLSKLPAKSVTVVIDACFSGENVHQNISSILPKVKDPVFKLPNGVLLSSSQATEPSSWFGKQEHGLFTYFFLRAIKDKENSDLNKDGKLTFQEIYNYISSPTEGIPYYARRLHGREQHPTLQGSGNRIFVDY